jgi:hypothetical protein
MTNEEKIELLASTLYNIGEAIRKESFAGLKLQAQVLITSVLSRIDYTPEPIKLTLTIREATILHEFLDNARKGTAGVSHYDIWEGIISSILEKTRVDKK